MHSEAFWCMLKPSDAIWSILKHSVAFWCILKPADAFWSILMQSEAFWSILKHAGNRKLLLRVATSENSLLTMPRKTCTKCTVVLPQGLQWDPPRLTDPRKTHTNCTVGPPQGLQTHVKQLQTGEWAPSRLTDPCKTRANRTLGHPQVLRTRAKHHKLHSETPRGLRTHVKHIQTAHWDPLKAYGLT